MKEPADSKEVEVKEGKDYMLTHLQIILEEARQSYPYPSRQEPWQELWTPLVQQNFRSSLH